MMLCLPFNPLISLVHARAPSTSRFAVGASTQSSRTETASFSFQHCTVDESVCVQPTRAAVAMRVSHVTFKRSDVRKTRSRFLLPRDHDDDDDGDDCRNWIRTIALPHRLSIPVLELPPASHTLSLSLSCPDVPHHCCRHHCCSHH